MKQASSNSRMWLILLLVFGSLLCCLLPGHSSELYPLPSYWDFRTLASWSQPKIATGTELPPIASAAVGDLFIKITASESPILFFRSQAGGWLSFTVDLASFTFDHSALSSLSFELAGHTGFASSGAVISEHNGLGNLDFDSSGHTGFASEGSIVTDHSALANLDFDSSGHTGFASEGAIITGHSGLAGLDFDSSGHTGFASSGDVITDHAALDNLDFEASGHTGFASVGSILAPSSHDQLFNLDYDSSGHTGFVPENLPIKTVVATYSVLASDTIILLDAAGGSFTVSLPSASGIDGKTFELKKIDSTSNLIFIDPNGSETIDGVLGVELWLRWASITIVSDGSNWMVR